MAKRIDVPVFSGEHGELTVVENLLPNGIKRVFFIRQVPGKKRGEHRHKRCSHLMLCLTGHCTVYVHSGRDEQVYHLNRQTDALLLLSTDWREMYDFSDDCVLVCLSDTAYDSDDYIYEPYPLVRQAVAVE